MLHSNKLFFADQKLIGLFISLLVFARTIWTLFASRGWQKLLRQATIWQQEKFKGTYRKHNSMATVPGFLLGCFFLNFFFFCNKWSVVLFASKTIHVIFFVQNAQEMLFVDDELSFVTHLWCEPLSHRPTLKLPFLFSSAQCSRLCQQKYLDLINCEDVARQISRKYVQFLHPFQLIYSPLSGFISVKANWCNSPLDTGWQLCVLCLQQSLVRQQGVCVSPKEASQMPKCPIAQICSFQYELASFCFLFSLHSGRSPFITLTQTIQFEAWIHKYKSKVLRK